MPPRPQNSAAKGLITLGLVALYILARKVPLPTFVADAGARHQTGGGESIMALGVRPLLTGYILVECAALLVPSWRPLRAGSPAGRAQLHQASVVVGLILALGQAIVLVATFERRGAAVSSTTGTMIILMGATAALLPLTWFVDRRGLGSGFAPLILAVAILGITGPLGNALAAVRFGTIPLSALITEILGLAVLVFITLFLFSSYGLPDTLPHALMISRPACGVAPLTVVPQSLLIAALVLGRLIRSSGTSTQTTPISPPGMLFPCLIATFVFAFLFNRPERISAAWNALSPNPPEGIPRLKAVMLESVLFIALAVGVQEWLVHWLGRQCVPEAVTVILATGVIFDLVCEGRARENNSDLVAIWEIHQIYTVVPAMRLLEAQGLHPFARGLHLRSLLQFFGPYVPVQILVPIEEAKTGCALLQSQWPGLSTSQLQTA